MAELREIIIREAPNGDGFDCLIRPAPVFAPWDAESLPTYRKARRKAECLRIVHPDWKIRDDVPAARREMAA